MADLTRADELVQTIERDDAFRAELQAAPTISAKRLVLDTNGFRDVGLEDIRAYVEGKGGQLILPDGGRELSEQELAAVAGGIDEGALVIGLVLTGPIAFVGVLSVAAAAA